MKQTLAKRILAIVCALMFLSLAGCTSTPPQEGSNLPQPTTSEPSAMSETPARSDIRDDALAASPVAYPKPFEPGYFTALNNPVILAECMGVSFSADESAEFTTPYDCNIDRCVLAENTGELSVLIAWKVSSQAQGLSPDDIMTHPQPQMLVLDPGKSTVIRLCWQYSPVDIALSDATFNVEIDVIERNTMQRESVRFDLHNNVTVTEHSKPLPGNATVSGKIISADTGEPLCNVPIEISDANFRYILSTDNNGEYEASVFAYKNARGYYLEYAMLVNAEASNAQIHMQQGNNNDFAAFGQARRAFAPKPGDELIVDIALQPKTTTFTRYGTFIRNSIISGNTGLDLANKVYTSGESNYPVTIVDGSIAYSLIDDDGSSLTFDGSGHYEHPVLGKISRIASSAYSNRIAGDPLFADATSGDYHLKSTAGRWNGSAWVTDAVASPCIDAGDPASAYANEPAPNGGCINLGCYGNTAEASKSAGGGTADTTPPSWNASSALTASAVTQTGATLSWSGASDDTGVTAYRLYQDGVLVQTTSNTSCAVSGLSPDTDYSFKVEAGDAADNWSTDGPTTPVHTLAATTPSVTVTANPSGSVGVGTAVTLTATPTGIASPSYQWYSNTTASSTGGNEISGATNATYQPSTATAGTIYYYCVVGGVTSNVVGVTVTSAPPVTYTITATAGANGSISPSGAVTVSHGGNQQFAITPNAGYRIADVRVDGSSVGAVSSYTFNNITASHTITASFAYNDDDDTSPRTLTDPTTGITASGNISAGAVLTVGNMALGSDAASNTIRSWINAEDYVLLRGVDISLSGSFTGVLTLTLPVGTQYNGDTVTILHAKKDGTLATYTATVRNGKVTFDVTGLSPFAVFMEDGLDDIPKTGDAGSAWIWWALLAVSGAGIITLVLTKKKVFQKR